jgi:hypothetical protein
VADDGGETDLEEAIAAVYAGPLDGFISRRDALAKELRSSKRRAAANEVKALRKPSRAAWALNAVTVGAPEAVNRLIDAVAGTLDAQASGGDVRAAIAELRAAVRDLAGRAARAAADGGQRLEESALANAVLAVIGKPDVFEALRAARLVDVPDVGSLDFLASLPPPPANLVLRASTGASPSTSPRPAQAVPATSARRAPGRAKAASSADATAAEAAPSPERIAAFAAQREAARQARLAAEAAEKRSADVQRALESAEARAAEADARLRQAEEEARTARAEVERARRQVDAAAARLQETATAAADAAAKLAGMANPDG